MQSGFSQHTGVLQCARSMCTGEDVREVVPVNITSRLCSACGPNNPAGSALLQGGKQQAGQVSMAKEVSPNLTLQRFNSQMWMSAVSVGHKAWDDQAGLMCTASQINQLMKSSLACFSVTHAAVCRKMGNHLYLKAILCHLVLHHPNCCIVGQHMQWQLLSVKCCDKVADGPAPQHSSHKCTSASEAQLGAKTYLNEARFKCRYSTKPLLRDLPATRFSSSIALHQQHGACHCLRPSSDKARRALFAVLPTKTRTSSAMQHVGMSGIRAGDAYSSPRLSFLVAKMTCAPQLASALHISKPRPVFPPVTIATLPSMSTFVRRA